MALLINPVYLISAVALLIALAEQKQVQPLASIVNPFWAGKGGTNG